jgi:hypothetical protein
VFYLIPSPIFRDVWRLYSNTPHSKGMAADRGGWVIGAFRKSSMPHFCPKFLSRPRYLAVPCNVDEAQACAISMRRIRSSINSCTSPDIQVSSRPRTDMTVHASKMKGERVMAGGVGYPMWPSPVLSLRFFSHLFNMGDID